MKKFDFKKFQPMPKQIHIQDEAVAKPDTKIELYMLSSIHEAEQFKKLINRPPVRSFTFPWHKDRTGSVKYGPYSTGDRAVEEYFTRLLKTQENKEQFGYFISRLDYVEGKQNLIGWAIIFNLKDGLADIGIWLDPAYAGRGRGTAIIRKLQKELEERGIDKFKLTHIAGVERSARLAEKLGFDYVGTVKNYSDNPIIDFAGTEPHAGERDLKQGQLQLSSGLTVDFVTRAYAQENYLRCQETSCSCRRDGKPAKGLDCSNSCPYTRVGAEFLVKHK